MLASTALHTEALAELKAMLTRYMEKEKDSDEGSPLLPKTIFENQVTMPSIGVPKYKSESTGGAGRGRGREEH